MQEVLTVQEASEFLRISLKSCYKYIKTVKGFPSMKLGKRIIISKNSLEEWVKENSGIVS